MNILALDQGNSSLNAGLFTDDRLSNIQCFDTAHLNRLPDYRKAVTSFLEKFVTEQQILQVGICCSKPLFAEVLQEIVAALWGAQTLCISSHIKTDIAIDPTVSGEVGADLIAAAQGAYILYGGEVLVIDLGTATTFSYIDKVGFLKGVVICPGLPLIAEAFKKKLPHLPEISLEFPGKILGENTVDCLKSGILWGHTTMVEGLVRKIKKELDGNVTTVICGGISNVIAPYADFIDFCCPELLLRGINILCSYNRK